MGDTKKENSEIQNANCFGFVFHVGVGVGFFVVVVVVFGVFF